MTRITYEHTPLGQIKRKLCVGPRNIFFVTTVLGTSEGGLKRSSRLKVSFSRSPKILFENNFGLLHAQQIIY